jgi:hypothetical protein
MSIEVESTDGETVVEIHRAKQDGHVTLVVNHLDDDGDRCASCYATGVPIRDLLIALHALSGTPAPEPAKPVRPKFRPVSGWFGRRKD